MINLDILNSSFKQSCNSCVLASYAVISNYYTKIAINQFFKDYCNHFNIIINSEVEKYCQKMGFKINKNNEYECTYDYHFQKEWKKRNCAGLKVIEELHNFSTQPSFNESRNKFDVEYVEDVNKILNEIEKRLVNENVLLVSALRVTHRGVHISSFGYDSKKKWFTVDTRPKYSGITYINSISSFGEPIDGLISINK